MATADLAFFNTIDPKGTFLAIVAFAAEMAQNPNV